MRVLLTGATGILGRAVMKHFLKAGVEMLGVSRRGLLGSFRCDLTQLKEVKHLFDNQSFDIILHAAAMSDVDGCERDPKEAHLQNGEVTRLLALQAKEKGVVLITISSDYVFNTTSRSKIKEEDPPCPVNVYGLTKLEAEAFSRLSPRSIVIRLSWLFGEGNENNFVNAIARRLKVEKSLSIANDQENAPTYAEDAAKALLLIVQQSLKKSKKEKAFQETYHFTNEGSTTRYQMALVIKDLMHCGDVSIHPVPSKELPDRPAKRAPYSVLSTDKFARAFGIHPRPWKEALKDYLGDKKLCAS